MEDGRASPAVADTDIAAGAAGLSRAVVGMAGRSGGFGAGRDTARGAGAVGSGGVGVVGRCSSIRRRSVGGTTRPGAAGLAIGAGGSTAGGAGAGGAAATGTSATGAGG